MVILAPRSFAPIGPSVPAAYNRWVPELPEVQALAQDLTHRLAGRTVDHVDLVAFSALKTFDPPLTALSGAQLQQVVRHGKFLDICTTCGHLIIHLARAGWVRWRDEVPTRPPRPSSRSPLAARVVLVGDAGLEITEAGTKKSLALYVVGDPHQVPGIARLGPDPLAPEFTVAALAGILDAAGKSQLKGVLRAQSTIAGIGNAYSDEILHAARLSPYKPASSLTPDQVADLHATIRRVLGEAVDRASGLAAAELKGEKKANLAVHGRAGQPCPVCADTVREVSFADTSLQYCPTCQTGGKPLADRRMSRLLK